jgi:adenylyltransferase/sulfurtransferase
LIGRLLLYNARDMSFEFVRLRKNPKCKVCGENPSVRGLIDYDEFCGVPGHEFETGSAGEPWDITPSQLDSQLKSGTPLCLVDVREPHELEISHIDGTHILFGEGFTKLRNLKGGLNAWAREVDPSQPIY